VLSKGEGAKKGKKMSSRARGDCWGSYWQKSKLNRRRYSGASKSRLGSGEKGESWDECRGPRRYRETLRVFTALAKDMSLEKEGVGPYMAGKKMVYRRKRH